MIGLSETICDATYQSSAIALTQVTAHFIPRNDVLSMMTDEPEADWHSFTCSSVI